MKRWRKGEGGIGSCTYWFFTEKPVGAWPPDDASFVWKFDDATKYGTRMGSGGRFVYGNYATLDEAKKAIEDYEAKGSPFFGKRRGK